MDRNITNIADWMTYWDSFDIDLYVRILQCKKISEDIKNTTRKGKINNIRTKHGNKSNRVYKTPHNITGKIK